MFEDESYYRVYPGQGWQKSLQVAPGAFAQYLVRTYATPASEKKQNKPDNGTIACRGGSNYYAMIAPVVQPTTAVRGRARTDASTTQPPSFGASRVAPPGSGAATTRPTAAAAAAAATPLPPSHRSSPSKQKKNVARQKSDRRHNNGKTSPATPLPQTPPPNKECGLVWVGTPGVDFLAFANGDQPYGLI